MRTISEETKLLEITNKVYGTYLQTVKDRERTSWQDARKILTRNMLLAHKADSTDYKGQMYQYGRLWFVVIDNTVVWIRNYCDTPRGWKKDNELYEWLNEELGIESTHNNNKEKYRNNNGNLNIETKNWIERLVDRVKELLKV